MHIFNIRSTRNILLYFIDSKNSIKVIVVVSFTTTYIIDIPKWLNIQIVL